MDYQRMTENIVRQIGWCLLYIMGGCFLYYEKEPPYLNIRGSDYRK